MSSRLPAFLNRRIWSFNVEVAHYTHPAWLAEFRKTWPARWVRDAHNQSLYLISTHGLALTRPEIMQSPFERIALLSASDTHQLIRGWMARYCTGYLRANVAGRIARGNARVLGTAVVDAALAAHQQGGEGGSMRHPNGISQITTPADLAVLHRRVLRTIYEHLSPEVAARFRLRFRPGCFHCVDPIHDLNTLESWLVSVEMRGHLSMEGACILSVR